MESRILKIAGCLNIQEQLCERSIRRFKIAHIVGKHCPEVLTTARAEPSGNPRSAFVWYILMMAYMNDKFPYCVVNMDGHQLMVTEKGTGEMVAHYCCANSDEANETRRNSHIFKIFIYGLSSWDLCSNILYCRCS